MSAKRGIPCITLASFIIVALALWATTARVQEACYRDIYDYYKAEIKRGPIPGRIIVSISQSPQQADFFSMQDGRVVFKGQSAATSKLSVLVHRVHNTC
jgi:hypothetical protein